VPTPLAELAPVAGIQAVVDVSDLPPTLVAQKPRLLDRILGAVLFRERVIYLDQSQVAPRLRFTNGHELIHKLIPWHEAPFRLDGHRDLFGPTKQLLETEANFGAADLLFQNSVFMGRALDSQLSLDSPIALADDFEVSLHAAIRYYVDNHPDAVALVVGGRISRDGTVPIWLETESPAFRGRYGRVHEVLNLMRLPVESGSPVGDVVAAAMHSLEVVRGKLELRTSDNRALRFVADAFYNQYCTFLLVSEEHRLNLGRKITVRAAGQVAVPR
jgi:hypothetical protein